MDQSSGRYVQPSFADLGTPLSEVTFTVVDLETTGVASDACAITEIGAVKVKGGEVLGEYSTLVNPGELIDSRISALTGITNAMVADAPSIHTALPAFLEFAAGSIWVAHNAPFDMGFLRTACQLCGQSWPRPQVVDTVVLARRLVDRSEVPNKRLSTLARYFGANVSPTHRAFDDARATVDVLHSLIERLGSHYVHTDTDLAEFQRAIPAVEQRRKRHLAVGLPHEPGVYVFRDQDDRPLYIGTSNNIATRVRSYFTAAETRSRMRDMLRAAQRVEAVKCAHRLEASVRELRMIAGAKPPFNKRSKYPERLTWLRTTREAFPRLSLVRTPPEPTASWLGPFTSRRRAQEAMDAVFDALPVRQCHTRLSARVPSSACAMAEMGCPAPCRLEISIEAYADIVHKFTSAVNHDPSPIVQPLLNRLESLARSERFEEAANVRSRLTSFLHAATRAQRVRALVSIPELIAAKPMISGGWELIIMRYGKLAGADVSPPRINPMPTIDSMAISAASVIADDSTLAAGNIAETELLLTWLETDSVRLVRNHYGWSMPIKAAASYHRLLEKLSHADDLASHTLG